jgi:hypothetical protein
VTLLERDRDALLDEEVKAGLPWRSKTMVDCGRGAMLVNALARSSSVAMDAVKVATRHAANRRRARESPPLLSQPHRRIP